MAIRVGMTHLFGAFGGFAKIDDDGVGSRLAERVTQTTPGSPCVVHFNSGTRGDVCRFPVRLAPWIELKVSGR